MLLLLLLLPPPLLLLLLLPQRAPRGSSTAALRVATARTSTDGLWVCCRMAERERVRGASGASGSRRGSSSESVVRWHAHKGKRLLAIGVRCV